MVETGHREDQRPPLHTPKTSSDPATTTTEQCSPAHMVDYFRRVARQATQELIASEQKGKELTSYCEPYATWRCVTLAVLIVCFVAGTPLSLLLTLPAYILADRADMLSQQGLKAESRHSCILSVALNLLAMLMSVTCAGVALFVYMYVSSRT